MKHEQNYKNNDNNSKSPFNLRWNLLSTSLVTPQAVSQGLCWAGWVLQWALTSSNAPNACTSTDSWVSSGGAICEGDAQKVPLIQRRCYNAKRPHSIAHHCPRSQLHLPGSSCTSLFPSSAPFFVFPSRWALPSSLIGRVGVFLCSRWSEANFTWQYASSGNQYANS